MSISRPPKALRVPHRAEVRPGERTKRIDPEEKNRLPRFAAYCQKTNIYMIKMIELSNRGGIITIDGWISQVSVFFRPRILPV